MKRSAKKCVAGLIALVAGICILPASVPAYTLNHVLSIQTYGIVPILLSMRGPVMLCARL